MSERQILLILEGVEQIDDLSRIIEVKGQAGMLLISRQREMVGTLNTILMNMIIGLSALSRMKAGY